MIDIDYYQLLINYTWIKNIYNALYPCDVSGQVTLKKLANYFILIPPVLKQPTT